MLHTVMLHTVLMLHTVVRQDFRIPMGYNQGATYKMPADDISDYRAQAHRVIHEALLVAELCVCSTPGAHQCM